MLLTSIALNGQISPGDLTTAHAEFEGMGNCTQCHDIGNKIPNNKCLECHEEIQNLINGGLGYHSSKEVVNKDCIDCHSEHHGRKFDMVRFDQDNFDHELTGYILEGQHDVIECRDCHKSDFIFNSDIKKRENTFLGLGQDCVSCHDDYHQETLGTDCISCHDIEAFRPAPKFDHNDANFVLRGEHISVECIDCHVKEQRTGAEFQNFVDIPFNDCIACHDDVHKGQLDAQCKTCHTETSFNNFIGKKYFDHSTTLFELKGKHKTTDCFACHENVENPLFAFQSINGTEENNCVSCHDDVHEGKFGLDCVKCHNEESFLLLNSMDFFDHNVTDYPLEGKHIEVDCKECHTGRYTDPIDFAECKNCHDDYHNGEFIKEGSSPDCKTCHSLDEGFAYSLFTFDDHQETVFPLQGAHIATPCFACHLSDDHWTFRNIGEDCIDCHDDIHKDYISPNYYEDSDCTTCHNSDQWAQVNFDHTLTEWPLEGQHKEVDCKSCHFEQIVTEENVLGQLFNGISTACESCHDNVHGDQFTENGITDCTRCHSSEGWDAEFFNHDATAFPLEGRHAEIDCNACHKQVFENGIEIIEYKIERFECIDCHS